MSTITDTTDVFEITNPELLTRIESINNGTLKDIVTSGQSQEITSYVTGTLSGGELANIVDGNYEIPINDGTVNFMHYEGTGFVDAPTTSTTAIQKTVPAGPITQYNSNTTAIQRGRVVQPYGVTIDNNGKVVLSSSPNSGSFGANAAYFLGEVNQAVAAASVGISLGKIIDSTLYSTNPNFWDSLGMSSINPELWGTITHGDDSFGAALFNLVFGINPDTNKGQAYIDEQAYAYLAYALAQNDFFSVGGYVLPDASQIVDNKIVVSSGLSLEQFFDMVEQYFVRGIDWANSSYTKAGIINLFKNTYTVPDDAIFCGTASIVTSAISGYGSFYIDMFRTARIGDTLTLSNSGDHKTYYESRCPGFSLRMTASSGEPARITNVDISTSNVTGDIPYSLTSSRISFTSINVTQSSDAPAGTSDQTGATIPDTSTWNDIPSTLQSLQNQYPDLWNDAISYNQIQPDGTLKPTTYIPVGYPSTSTNPWTDTQPTTNNQPTSQTQPQIDLDTWPNPETSPMTRTLTQTPTTNPNPDSTVPQNPSDTGSGSSPTPTAPTGNASALWSVYHPTQGQIDSFGAWLWGSPFLTDIGKLFQNPIDGVISLHKVFATPVDSGTGTIVVGTLNSNVSSATVNQQYIEVDCGSVNCFEDFGNVFDYEPYTKVSLYLPFIGIVPLNVSDVMRSTISITYGVDVFTGACIAMVEVSRDGGNINMYQYTGNCAVHYPLSNVQQSQLISGLLGIAAGVGSVLATGGVSAPAVLGMAGGALAAGHTSIGRSGGFSANAGAMGIKVPYLIIERPQTKVAETFPNMDGYPTNYSVKLGSCSNHVVCKTVHVYGINATESELAQIEQILKDGVEV